MTNTKKMFNIINWHRLAIDACGCTDLVS